ncbi:MAG: hypothetical protein GF329_03205 [Candidatus Lokiarchaeota archaeon]|nr:hypothetical protein [Candidatus Lokiarchaeota archaeon]
MKILGAFATGAAQAIEAAIKAIIFVLAVITLAIILFGILLGILMLAGFFLGMILLLNLNATLIYSGSYVGFNNNKNQTAIGLGISIAWTRVDFIDMNLPVLDISIIFMEHCKFDAEFSILGFSGQNEITNEIPESNTNKESETQLKSSTLMSSIEEAKQEAYDYGALLATIVVGISMVTVFFASKLPDNYKEIGFMMTGLTVSMLAGLMGLITFSSPFTFVAMIGYGYDLFVWGLSFILVGYIPKGGTGIASAIRTLLSTYVMSPLGYTFGPEMIGLHAGIALGLTVLGLLVKNYRKTLMFIAGGILMVFGVIYLGIGMLFEGITWHGFEWSF